MIKANELRLGNLVYDTLGKVNTINIEALTYISKEPLNQVKPIPLTEDWYLKLGFKSMLNGNRFHINNFIVSNCVDGWRLTYMDGKIKSKVISFVHELQNLYYALVSEELQIK